MVLIKFEIKNNKRRKIKLHKIKRITTQIKKNEFSQQ